MSLPPPLSLDENNVRLSIVTLTKDSVKRVFALSAASVALTPVATA